MKKVLMILVLVLFAGCQTSRSVRLEGDLKPYKIEDMSFKVVVEVKG